MRPRPLGGEDRSEELLIEGRNFEKVSDPRLGMVPGKGCFEMWHEPHAIRTLLPEATLLRDQARRMRGLWNARA